VDKLDNETMGDTMKELKPDAALTDEQIENWRRVLLVTLGPFALLMKREEIQAYKERMQTNVDKIR